MITETVRLSWYLTKTVRHFVEHCICCDIKIVENRFNRDSYYHYNDFLTRIIRQWKTPSFFIPEDIKDSDIKQFTRIHKRMEHKDKNAMHFEFIKDSGAITDLWDLTTMALCLIDIINFVKRK